MRKRLGTIAASAAGLVVLVMASNPGIAATANGAAKPTQLAHMSQGQYGGQGCPGMMGPGMGGQGMMGQSMMPMMQQMHRGKMGPGIMGPGMGGQGMMGRGKMGPGFGSRVVPQQDLSADDVRHYLEHRLAMHGNPLLKVGEVKEKNDDTVVADIVTADGSLVERFEVDRHTGQLQRVN